MDDQEKKFRSAILCHRAQCAQSRQIQVQVAMVSGLGHLHQFPSPALFTKPPLLFLLRSSLHPLPKYFPLFPSQFFFPPSYQIFSLSKYVLPLPSPFFFSSEATGSTLCVQQIFPSYRGGHHVWGASAMGNITPGNHIRPLEAESLREITE